MTRCARCKRPTTACPCEWPRQQDPSRADRARNRTVVNGTQRDLVPTATLASVVGVATRGPQVPGDRTQTTDRAGSCNVARRSPRRDPPQARSSVRNRSRRSRREGDGARCKPTGRARRCAWNAANRTERQERWTRANRSIGAGNRTSSARR